MASTMSYTGGTGFFANDRSLPSFVSVLPTYSIFTSNACVGINTKTPQAALDVSGTVACTGFTASNPNNYALQVNGYNGNYFQIAEAFGTGAYSATANAGDTVLRTMGTGQLILQNNPYASALAISSNCVYVGSNLAVSNTLQVGAASTLNGPLTLNANAQFNQGVTCASNVSVGSNLIVNNTLQVGSYATFYAPVTHNAYSQFNQGVAVVGNLSVGSNLSVGGNALSAVSDLSPHITLYNSPTTVAMNGGVGSLQETGNPGSWQFYNGFFGGTDNTGNPTPPKWNYAKLLFRGCPNTSHSTAYNYTETTSLSIMFNNGGGWVHGVDFSVTDAGMNFGFTSQMSCWFQLPSWSYASFYTGTYPAYTGCYLGIRNNSTISDYKFGVVLVQFKS